MRRTIVDTSVFVSFLRGEPEPLFEALLRTNSVLLSPWVRLELLQGVRRHEATLLGRLLGGIPGVPWRAEVFELAEEMVARVKGSGLTLGLVDLLIAAQAASVDAVVLSNDGVFERLDQLGLVRSARRSRRRR